jgi:4-amino-4-deoxy-L-arabinose transferase-like glycosyltransferase
MLVLIGAGLRLWQLDSLPAVIHRDEAAIGYNAYSILMTGRDEHGVSWPISFRSFGDYKLPGLIYLTSLSIKLLGINTLAVRLPTALAAIATIPVVYWLTRELGWRKQIAILAAALLTLDFWHISQARNAYEPMLGLFFTAGGLASWLAGLKQPKFLPLAVLAFILGALFYNVPFMLLPLLYLGSWVVNYQHKSQKLKIRKGTKWVGLTLLSIFISLLLLSWLTRGVSESKFNTTVLSHPDIIESSKTTVHAGLVAGWPSWFARGLSHPLIMGGLQAIKGYASAFDLTYLFFIGDHNSWHNLRAIGLGNMNPILIFAWVTGSYLLIKNASRRESQLTALYFFLSPLISALTIDAPITNRLLDFHLAILIISAVGTDYWLTVLIKSKKLVNRLVFPTVTLLYFGFFGLFLLRYFSIYNLTLSSSYNPGVNEMVAFANRSLGEYDRIYVNFKLGYSFFAFYTPFEPEQFQSQAKREIVGFDQVSEFGPYRFADFPNWSDLDTENVTDYFDNQAKNNLIIEKGEPTHKKDLVWQKIDWQGQWEWSARAMNLDQAIDELQALPESTDRTLTLTYLQSCQQGKCDQNLLR